MLSGANNNVYLSSRNLTRTQVINGSDISTYGVLNAGKVVLTEGSLEVIESNFSK